MKLHSSLMFLLAAAASTSSTARAASLRGNHAQQVAQENNNAAQRQLGIRSAKLPQAEPGQDVGLRLSPLPEQPNNNFGLSAHQLGRVETLNGDHWEMNPKGDNGWTEFKADGKKSFHWKETGRDVNSVYLQDNSGRGAGTTARVDLYYGTIMYCYQKNNCLNLRKITSAHTINKFGLNAQNLHSVVVPNGNHWVSGGNKVWTELQANGQYISHLKESHRDLNSVYLENSNGHLVQLDLYRGEIMYCYQIGSCFSLHDIIAASD